MTYPQTHPEYQYLNLLTHIRDNGRVTDSRNDTGSRSIFGYQMRFPLAKGFPLLTTKKMHLRNIIHELLWFLTGSTNANVLAAEGVDIWDKWGLSKDTEVDGKLYKQGDLGPGIYSAMWRAWPTTDGNHIDQIQQVIDDLTKTPLSRRIIVSGWNPEYRPDESKTHDENIIDGKAVLPPCHTLFQFKAYPLYVSERMELLSDDDRSAAYDHVRSPGLRVIEDEDKRHGHIDAALHTWLDERNVPGYRLDCQLYARSQDVPVGTPYNIASYALFTHMVAHVCNMVPGDYIHSMGDSHIYSNQWEGVTEQLTRMPRKMPRLWLNPEVKSIFDFKPEDIELRDYDPHPFIKFEVAA